MDEESEVLRDVGLEVRSSCNPVVCASVVLPTHHNPESNAIAPSHCTTMSP